VTKNEQAFRAYNERRERFELEALPEAVAEEELVPFVCECADLDCHAAVALTIPEFEAAHDGPDRYTVKPGHVLPEFEGVSDKHERYWVVEKFTSPHTAVAPHRG
jgi:hypothetical protein